MTECTRSRFILPSIKGWQAEAECSGGDINSDGGLLLLRLADRYPGLPEAVNALT